MNIETKTTVTVTLEEYEVKIITDALIAYSEKSPTDTTTAIKVRKDKAHEMAGQLTTIITLSL